MGADIRPIGEETHETSLDASIAGDGWDTWSYVEMVVVVMAMIVVVEMTAMVEMIA